MDVESRATEPYDVEIERLRALDDKFGKEGLTFDDVLLRPAESHVLPNDVSTATRLTPRIELAIPIVSAAMDTVTEARLAIALAREGGIGIVHRNLSIADQVAEVDKVKRSESGMIVEPVTLPPDAPVAQALELMERYHISGVPIADDAGRHHARGGERDPRATQDRETPGRRRRRPPARAHHGEGHPEADRVPARDEGRAGPAPRGRRGRRRPGRDGARAGARR